jgi:hypothetical protein
MSPSKAGKTHWKRASKPACRTVALPQSRAAAPASFLDFVNDDFELGALLLEALAVLNDIRNRLIVDPENALLAVEYIDMRATVLRLAAAYLDSAELHGSA